MLRSIHPIVWIAFALSLGFSVDSARSGCLQCIIEEVGPPAWYEYHCMNLDEDGWSVCTATTTGCSWSGACTHSDPGCFLAETMVATPEGQRPIEELRIGDRLWSVAPDGARVAATVTETHRDTSHGFYIINGRTRVTASHRFLVGSSTGIPIRYASTEFDPYESHLLGEWRPVSDLLVGDAVRMANGEMIQIDDLEFVDVGVRVYNLEVEPHQNYIADGFVVHNRKPGFRW